MTDEREDSGHFCEHWSSPHDCTEDCVCGHWCCTHGSFGCDASDCLCPTFIHRDERPDLAKAWLAARGAAPDEEKKA